MKRILSILLAILLLSTLLLAPTASADDKKMGYKLTGGGGEIGDTVKVIVSVENAPEIISYETVFLYDPAVLKPTGTYQKMYMGGMMAFNPNYPSPVEGKGAIKVAAIGTTKAIMQGDLDLYNFVFEIIGKTTDEKGSLVEIQNYSFSQDDANLTKVPSLIVTPCRIAVPVMEPDTPETETPAEPTPETPSAPDSPETETPEADTPSDEKPDTDTSAKPTPETPSTGDSAAKDPVTNTPADPTPEIEEDKKPTGDWYIFEDQAILAEKDENGKDVLHQFTTEYEKDEEGKTTGVILYDEEEKEAGRLTVNEDEYGNLTVIEQDMKKDKSFSPWFLLPIGAAVLIAIGGVVLAIKSKKK